MKGEWKTRLDTFARTELAVRFRHDTGLPIKSFHVHRSLPPSCRYEYLLNAIHVYQSDVAIVAVNVRSASFLRRLIDISKMRHRYFVSKRYTRGQTDV